jgi:Major Facilitator Superfamily
MPERANPVAPPRPRLIRRLASVPWLSVWMPMGADVQSRNMRNVLLDGLGVGVASAATPFLPILLARLGASDFAVGLLTSMPAFAGLLFALPVSRFLARQRYIPAWYSGARLLVISGYALSGLATLLAPDHRVVVILLIWALLTLPQIIVDVTFTIVMAGVAGPDRRFYLMSRRWSSLGLMTAITVALAGFTLNHIAFPLDYEIVFPLLALGGLFSYNFASRIQLPSAQTTDVAPAVPAANPKSSLRESLALLRGRSKFLRFTASQFVFRLGLAWALPLFPLYYVHTLRADDASIGLINTVNSAVLLVAYLTWARVSRRRGVRFALLVTTGAISLYPITLALTTQVGLVILLAGLAGIFAAGIDLVFFDTLVSSYPPESSALFVGWYQTTVYVATFVAPLASTMVAQFIGIPAALIAGGVLRLAGFALFAYLVK